jgi:hypothetical protein
MNRVVVTRPMIGLLYMQVCAETDATDEEILATCNRENLCGTTNGWAGVYRGDEEGKKPGPCDDHPGRTHFIVNC